MEAVAMSTTLNLVDHVLAMGRRYQDAGRTREAVRVLGRLASFREIPAATAEETQVRLAELQLKRRKFARARRHLTAALTYQPNSARLNHLMATATQADDRGDLDRAAEYFRRAIELEPENVPCLAQGGLLAVRLGHTEEGLALLRRAVERDADNADVVAMLVKGLRLAGQADEARAVLRAACFRNPHVRRFRRLWEEYQFQQARNRQDGQRRRRRLHEGEEAVLLPFVRVNREEHGTVRRDGPATVGRPHMARPARRIDQRHVQ
jgi:lipopolysaccharide biosynthesis regulator YciM